MNKKMLRIFIYSAGALLLVTAVAKFVSAYGGARILNNLDPILAIPFRHVLWIVATLESVVAFVCLFGKRIGLQAGMIAWLATNFVIYRLGLFWVGYQKPCSCLGSLTGALHMRPQTADTAMKVILGYLLIGSYAILFWLWKQKQSTPASIPSVKATV